MRSVSTRVCLPALFAALALAALLIFPGSPALHAQDGQPGASQAPKPVRKPVAKPAPKAGEVQGLEQPAQPQDTGPAVQNAPRQPAKPAGQPAAQGGAPQATAQDPNQAPNQEGDGPLVIRPVKEASLPAKSRLPGGKLVIGALLPLTGPLGGHGVNSKAAIELALEDVNNFLAENNSPDRVSVIAEDTGGVPAKALEHLKAMHAAGAKVIIGPYSDDEVDAVIEYAAKNGILLLSQGSAGPYLSQSGDNLLRFSPSDAYQAEAIAVLANQEGAKQVITIWEGDMYGDELVTHVKGQFANLGGQVIPGTRFRPVVSQFASYVADLKAQIDKEVKDKKKLAIVVAARGAQTAGILREAAKAGGLDTAKWYGCDDSSLRSAITEDKGVAQFAAKVRIAFARYGENGTDLYAEVEKRIEDRTKTFVDAQAVVAYDILWLAATTAINTGIDSGALRRAIPAAAERFYGASGWLALNERGDRREDYDFDFWTVKQIEGKYYWVKTARYQFDPGTGKQMLLNAPEKE